MGKVFEARDEKHGRSVAIKVLDPELAAAIGAARFRAEIGTAARLSHPHIVPRFDSGEADGLLYYVMPLLTGESLRQRLLRERQLPIEDTIRIAREISDALHYAHGQGLVHRDVKPENIVLAGGHALILDFGIARSADTVPSPETHTLATIGTPTYMSPEQSSGVSMDGRSDQYSLACVVYEMLTGQPPFSGPTGDSVLLQHRTLDPRPVTALRPTAPGYLSQALARALAKNPADRYPGMAAFGDAISSTLTPPGRGTPGSQAEGRRMLAVLPLENRSAEMELVSPASRAPEAQAEPASSEAYDAYLKGRFHWNRRTPEGLRLAIRWFEKAIELDPHFGRAYSGIADVHNVQITYFQAAPEK